MRDLSYCLKSSAHSIGFEKCLVRRFARKVRAGHTERLQRLDEQSTVDKHAAELIWREDSFVG